MGTPQHRETEIADQADHVVALGIDNLATLEELFGERLGAEIVSTMEEMIRPLLPDGSNLVITSRARFLITIKRARGNRVTALVAELQRNAAAKPVETLFGPVAVTISAGCACAERTGRDDVDNLKTVALHTLHMAMLRGVGAVEWAADEWALLQYRRELMSASLATSHALHSNDLVVVHQPVVRAEGGNTISFHECLVRIRQKNGVLLTAGKFMPAIERLGMATVIDRRVLALTLQTMREHPTARLSINIFPQTMQDRAWMELFEHEVGMEPDLGERLIVEVTESAAMLETDRTRAFMDYLRGYGVSFALDDFGAGHTSLRHLRDLRFDILKIDGRFIRDIEASPDDAFLVSTLVSIAQRFDMMTVAEAVQTPAEARCLSDLGVEYFQGFFFGSPSLRLSPTEKPMPLIAAQA
ncbi:MAG: EAL domain-containing protein [Pseudomonadota bacterium]